MKIIKENSFDVFHDVERIYLVSLVENDSNIDHYFTIWNNIIFDSTEKYGLKRNGKNLNYCCSYGEEIITYMRCDMVALFQKNHERRNRKKNMDFIEPEL